MELDLVEVALQWVVIDQSIDQSINQWIDQSMKFIKRVQSAFLAFYCVTVYDCHLLKADQNVRPVDISGNGPREWSLGQPFYGHNGRIDVIQLEPIQIVVAQTSFLSKYFLIKFDVVHCCT